MEDLREPVTDTFVSDPTCKSLKLSLFRFYGLVRISNQYLTVMAYAMFLPSKSAIS